MDYLEEIKRIDEHFKTISKKDFEENLLKAGFGEIKPGPLAMSAKITEKDFDSISLFLKISEEKSNAEIIMKPKESMAEAKNSFVCSTDFDMHILEAA